MWCRFKMLNEYVPLFCLTSKEDYEDNDKQFFLKIWQQILWGSYDVQACQNHKDFFGLTLKLNADDPRPLKVKA